MILAGAGGFEQQVATDFLRNFARPAVFNWLDTMKNERQELHELLSHLPDVSVASNFTARVMQAAEREEARRARRWNVLAWNWHSLLPRFAVATALLLFAGVAFHQHEVGNRPVEIARSIQQIPSVTQMPSVEALQNFDAIQRMSRPAHADEELLALAPNLQ